MKLILDRFLAKKKLPETVEMLDKYTQKFYEKLVPNDLKLKNEINVLYKTINGSLSQSKIILKSEDKKYVESFLKKYSSPLSSMDQMWDYYGDLAALQAFLKQSSADARY